ncbi:Rieske 2Fe-2S domain-containing protein [Xanthobacter agilis]|uniref:Toluene monooxygenase system ferredoxin subunit n=1 Tax=Xanthobacter agilis TaxID=47492 RepID=A0ABU0LDM7_XANAG|nr:Rieske 2Fe-2S domain-containing protein [Xanthobacter agilis]MDQ0505249.1 toluene monooxygenase system ferredoxin subunit [Xanthobacter agilis]
MRVKLCDLADLKEGTMLPVGIGYTLVLAVWPQGGAPRALQGLCPHAGELLIDARFDGRTITCRAHDWAFDAMTGTCTVGGVCTLVEYPSQILGGEMFVDIEGVRPNDLRR